ncbi:ABC transporter substrate-binding protein [Arthrobacter castelli]|uniref:ABC transporter substrate-binding protein n=1 Tax=Arthrobacter castelli TaxID=271431 RepID=UPI0003F86BAD|nr:ABC transporter substrate-binding protein [Arthrobacter castelli]
MKRKLSALLAAASVLAVSACGGGSPSGGGGETGGGETAGGSGGNGDLTPITVGVIPIVDTAPIWLGKEKGFFAEEGLKLELQTTSGGAAAVPGVVSGDFDFAFGNVVSIMVAADKGLGLEFVTNGASSAGLEGDGFSAVVVNEDSPIKSPADLEGKKVSVNNLSNIGDTTISHVVEEDGGDPSKVEFVEVGFPDAPAALANGQVDAAWILEPFLSSALEDGARVVSYNFYETHENLDIAGYFTGTEKMKNNPEMVEKFRAAMTHSLQYAQEHPEEVRKIVGTYTEISKKLRQEMVLPEYRAKFNREATELLGNAAAKYGTLSEPPNLDKILP